MEVSRLYLYLSAGAGHSPLESAAPDLFYKLRYYAHNTTDMAERIPNPHARGLMDAWQ